ncbi:two-component system sensor histidine kinase DesK [Paenibacillus harenae]|uniref:histidine kinase n=2 Tax=Paenibacillus harenae TaxID=306543 RepID=A0ABT9U3L9_PAEHA|nr:two-component system sensor histidine kinase DesK [Paenibacillus harenae]
MRRWLMLAPLIIPFIYLFCMPIRLAWLEIALFLLFAAAYRQTYVHANRRELFILIQLLSVSMMGVIESPWLLIFGVYPAICMRMLPSYRRISYMVGVMTVLFCGSIYIFYERLSDPWRYEWLPVILALALIPYTLKMYQTTVEVKSQLQNANNEIARLIKNEERQRIARDLHDTLGHKLSLISLKSELVERLIPDHPDQALAEARDVQLISRATLVQVRELISDMQSINMEEEFQQAEHALQTAGISFEYNNNVSLKMAPIIQNILGMSLRECVTNVIKHSHADKCEAALCEDRGTFCLIVQDNGTGLTKDNRNLGQFGNGLLGMKERLILIDGKLEWVSDPSKGTKVTVTVPNIKKPETEVGAR